MQGQPPRLSSRHQVPHSLVYLSVLCGYDCPNVPQTPLPLERDQGSSPRPLAKSLSSVAHRDLHWRQDDPDWLPGILGIYVARTPRTLALLALDRRDGTVRPPQTKKFLKGTHNTIKFCSSRLTLSLPPLRPTRYSPRLPYPRPSTAPPEPGSPRSPGIPCSQARQTPRP